MSVNIDKEINNICGLDFDFLLGIDFLIGSAKKIYRQRIEIKVIFIRSMYGIINTVLRIKTMSSYLVEIRKKERVDDIISQLFKGYININGWINKFTLNPIKEKDADPRKDPVIWNYTLKIPLGRESVVTLLNTTEIKYELFHSEGIDLNYFQIDFYSERDSFLWWVLEGRVYDLFVENFQDEYCEDLAPSVNHHFFSSYSREEVEKKLEENQVKNYILYCGEPDDPDFYQSCDRKDERWIKAYLEYRGDNIN
jgi:hypothetical protein